MYLFIDTETTGLPRSWSAPATDLSNWPRLVQLAWTLCNEEGEEIDAKDFIIKPENFSVPTDASRIHGITNDRAIKEGASLASVLAELMTVVNGSQILVAHNMSFDEKVLNAELIRAKVSDNLAGILKICTKEASTDHCKLPGNFGKFKWPTLQELHFTLFGEEFEETHNAVVDAQICAKCFFELKRLGVINVTSSEVKIANP